MYYVARDMRGQTVIGAAAAASDDPFGPYLDTGRPLISATESVGGAIDPHYFKVINQSTSLNHQLIAS